jgi:hypothetical protein
MSALCQKRTHAVQQFLPLFDHLVGAAKRNRHGKAEYFSRFQVGDEVDVSDLLNWKINRLPSLENPA